jgi:uncharacterized membrane protein YraQ (UPF0718 family)
MMVPLLAVTAAALAISFVFDREKSVLGIKKGLKMFFGILPSLLNILVIASVTISLVPQHTIVRLLGSDSGPVGVLIAALAGSVALIPGFIAFPLASILLKSGVSYAVTAVFITTLLMVGVFTLPLEAKYFGMRTAITRNLLSLVGAVIVGIIIGALM